MDAVVADDQRDVQTGLLVDHLHRARQVGRAGVQDGADVLVDDEVFEITAARVELHHLADLLFEGHAREQVGDSLTSEQIRILVR